jgi:N-acetylmuramoyl-L-alanine amidase
MIVIDPGHGGTAPIGNSSPNNAKGPRGTLEKTLTLDIGLRMQAALTVRGLTARVTRDSDVNLALKARAEVARAVRAPVFVSIHFNGANDPSVQGTETWTHAVASDASRRLAAAMQQAMLSVTRYRDRGVRNKQLGVLSPSFHDSQTSCCLVEISFLTDPADEDRLGDDTYRTAIAAALAEGVAMHLAGEQARLSDLLHGPPVAAAPEVAMTIGSLEQTMRGGCDHGPRTALMAAAGAGHVDIVALLLRAGASVDARNRDGWTALTFAAAGGHAAVVELLLAHGARVDDPS